MKSYVGPSKIAIGFPDSYDPRCEPPVSLVFFMAPLVFVLPFGTGKPVPLAAAPATLLSFLFFLLGISPIILA